MLEYRGRHIQVNHNGTVYKTLRDLVDKYNLSYNTVHKAIVEDGVDITKYIDYLEGNQNKIFEEKNITFRGTEFKDVLDIIRSYRIPKIKAIIELNSGKSLEEVIFKKNNCIEITTKKVIYINNEYKSLKALAVHLDVNYSYLQRLYLKTNNLEDSVNKAKINAERKRKLTKARAVFKHDFKLNK